MSLNILVIYGSVRTDRQGIKAARYIVEQVRDRRHHAQLIDPVEHPLPLLDKMYKEYPEGQAPEPLQKLGQWVKIADAYIVVSGEYNHSIPPALTNILDHFLEEYFWKPSAIVCYSAGAFAGVRAAMALRPMLAELGASSIPSILAIPRIRQAFDESGKPTDPALIRRTDKFLSELQWYGDALKAARVRDGKQVCPERTFSDTQDCGPR